MIVRYRIAARTYRRYQVMMESLKNTSPAPCFSFPVQSGSGMQDFFTSRSIHIPCHLMMSYLKDTGDLKGITSSISTSSKNMLKEKGE